MQTPAHSFSPALEESPSVCESRRVFVVIVTYNGEDCVRQCLDSLRENSPHSTVIVVDNASSDRTVEIVRSEYSEVELLPLRKNHGFGVGNNIGIAAALKRDAKYVFLLNQDAYIVGDCVEKLATFLDQNADFEVASPLHCSPDPTTVDRTTFRSYLRSHAIDYLSDACCNRVKSHYQIKGINAAAWFARASLFHKVGGFDPIFFMYGEDDDLISRLSFHKCRFALLPAATVVHLRQSPPGPSLNRWQLLQKRADRVRASLVVALKSPGNSMSFIASQLVARSITIPITEFLVKRQLGAMLASQLALLKVLVDLPRISRHRKLCSRPGAHFIR